MLDNERERRRVIREMEALLARPSIIWSEDDKRRILPCTEQEARAWNDQYCMVTQQDADKTWALVKRSVMLVDMRRMEVLYWNPYSTDKYRIIAYKGM